MFLRSLSCIGSPGRLVGRISPSFVQIRGNLSPYAQQIIVVNIFKNFETSKPYVLTFLDGYKVPFCAQTLEEKKGYLVSKDCQLRRKPFRVKLNNLKQLTTIDRRLSTLEHKVIRTLETLIPTQNNNNLSWCLLSSKQFRNSFKTRSNQFRKHYERVPATFQTFPKQFRKSSEQVPRQFPT